MRQIEKVSDITATDVADYIRLGELSNDDLNTLNSLLFVAKSYVRSYTGQKPEDIDKITDFVIVVLILCQDMYDNRTMYVDSTNINKVVESIMDLHSVNFL